MPSLVITKRETRSGRRYVVRYRLGGRAFPVVHGGSFKTEREAKVRRDLIGGELAAGRNPADLLRCLVEKPAMRSFADYAESYQRSRVDLDETTRKANRAHVHRMLSTFGTRDPLTITPGDVQAWIGSLDLKPSSMRRYIGTL